MTTIQKPGQKKTAVDAEAAKYWTDYYGESGYGALWVEEIPMKVKASLKLIQGGATKTASNASPTITPICTLITDDGVTLEGQAKYAGSKKTTLFAIDFDHDGQVLDFVSSDV